MTPERSLTDSNEPGELIASLSGLVTPVQIVEVNRRQFAGQVYNLQTAQHWYIANNIITHNCVRSFAPLSRGGGATQATLDGED